MYKFIWSVRLVNLILLEIEDENEKPRAFFTSSVYNESLLLDNRISEIFIVALASAVYMKPIDLEWESCTIKNKK